MYVNLLNGNAMFKYPVIHSYKALKLSTKNIITCYIPQYYYYTVIEREDSFR